MEKRKKRKRRQEELEKRRSKIWRHKVEEEGKDPEHEKKKWRVGGWEGKGKGMKVSGKEEGKEWRYKKTLLQKKE